MSRIGIMTVVNCDNNGTDIQAYAMQRLFEQIDSKVELINYRAKKWETINIRQALTLKSLLKFPIHIYGRIAHRAFRKKHLHLSERKYCIEDIKKLPYEKVVVGSDQIWNLDITDGDIGFFLPDKTVEYEKYSYAVSIGRTQIKDWEEKYRLSILLKQFQSISVREKTAVNALKEIGIKAHQDLDPILMLDSDEWNELAINTNAERIKYILVYLAQANMKAVEYAVELSNKENCDVIWVTDSIKHYREIKSKRFVSVEKWIGYVKNAELLITNSYHGLSMSICLNTPVCLFDLEGKPQSNARMQDLIKRLGLDSSAMWQDNATLSKYRVDWNSVNKKIHDLRQKSIEYIRGEISYNGSIKKST